MMNFLEVYRIVEEEGENKRNEEEEEEEEEEEGEKEGFWDWLVWIMIS